VGGQASRDWHLLQALQNELSNFIAQIMDEHKTSPSTQNW